MPVITGADNGTACSRHCIPTRAKIRELIGRTYCTLCRAHVELCGLGGIIGLGCVYLETGRPKSPGRDRRRAAAPLPTRIDSMLSVYWLPTYA